MESFSSERRQFNSRVKIKTYEFVVAEIKKTTCICFKLIAG